MKGNDPSKKSVPDYKLPNPAKPVDEKKPTEKKKEDKKDGEDGSPHTPHFQLPSAQNPQ